MQCRIKSAVGLYNITTVNVGLRGMYIYAEIGNGSMDNGRGVARMH